ncbi:peptidoglycan editing factor PgeF [Pseudomonadales bacterium]|nr:peptidoglycan editing factor PgeF [Pseudomonadales bacterium]MDB4151851.1 peptidoglycan editing factor PgeF [Pseudomonadales bacterium]MDC1307312.1 peptidoglycan editing factor PgeF [Pseudomonadales bacterium]
MTEPLLRPDWALPESVQSVVTTRFGGVSESPYGALNVALHVADQPARVAENRRQVEVLAELPAPPLWLQQVHGTRVLMANASSAKEQQADAAYTRDRHCVLAIMAADCLPILLCSDDGAEIAAIHAGWQGLAEHIIDETVARFSARKISAWLGPAIGPCHYEVDERVRSRFDSDFGFGPGKDDGHWMLDLFAVARRQLSKAGVASIAGGGCCTYCDSRFYSYRRDGQTGRFAALIWRR